MSPKMAAEFRIEKRPISDGRLSLRYGYTEKLPDSAERCIGADMGAGGHHLHRGVMRAPSASLCRKESR